MFITYIIGNGFDINNGMKTKYTDFYPYFKEKASTGNLILNWMLEDERAGEIEKWSDLEKIIGEKTELLGDELEKFEEDIMELADLLREYLKLQEGIVSYEGFENEIHSKLSSSITSYIDDGNPAQKRKINSILSNYSSQKYQYDFVTFNYTNVLDNICAVCNKVNKNISSHTKDSTKFDDVLGNILHVHGTLDNGLVIGVNDETQIKSELLAKSEFRTCLIKSYLNQYPGNLNEEYASQMIERSVIIVTFGLSIGETDRNWWKSIISWLTGSAYRILIINDYNPNIGEFINPQRLGKLNRNIFKRLELVCDFKLDQTIQERVLIYYNKGYSTFNFDFLTRNSK